MHHIAETNIKCKPEVQLNNRNLKNYFNEIVHRINLIKTT